MKKILLSILFIFFLCGRSYCQDDSRITSLKNQFEALKVEAPGLDEALNINISQTTLSNFLLAIAKVHSLNINVSPDLNNITIVNNFSNVAVSDILLFLVKEYNLDIDFTGNILSIRSYVAPKKEQVEKQIQVDYAVSTGNISLDLKNDPLERVFRKIMDLSGKNLLYTPDLQTTPLSIYINNVPFDVALSKLAESNNLTLSVSRDGFYVFDAAYIDLVGSEATTTSKPIIRRKGANFYYRVLDTLNRRVEIDLQNTPISDVIYSIGNDLKLDIFTASPLDNAGVTTVKAENIDFDLLLDKIFESATVPTQSSNRANNNAPVVQSKFTYKKEGDVYYFGTEDQLSLKHIEMVSMMHRSVQLLKNPSGNGQKRAGLNNYNTNNTPFNNSGTNFQNQNNNTTTRTNNVDTSANLSSIEDIIPNDISEGLDIKIDVELNSFIVSGSAAKVERFKNFIKFIDKPVPVILIEVMIIEVNRSTVTETGISFGIGDKPVTTQGEFFPNGNVTIGAKDVNKIIGNFDGFGSLNIGKVVPNFYLDIKAMEAAGTLKIRSTPKLMTINGHKAYLSSGETTYYAVTSQTFFGTQIPQTSEIRNYVPIDAELSLEILPFVSGDGQITLDIQVIQSAFNGGRIAEDAPPDITSREFSSIVRMQDQDVVVLGGIESIKKDDSGSGVPFLARIPIIKWFFSKKRREATKRNLNVMIKPTIIN